MKKLKIGLQLYSVREEMSKDFFGTLKNVKHMGYDYVEFAGYFGKSAEEIKEMLDSLQLKCISVHQTYDVFLKNPEQEIKFIKTLGAKYSAIPWMASDSQAGTPSFPKVIADIASTGKLLKENGIQLLYHNHDFEFEKFEGKTKLDILYSSISEEYLQTEIDTCWLKYAGYDPTQYLLKYSKRSPVVHLKDFTSNSAKKGPVYALIDENGKEIKKDKDSDGFKFKPVGQGVQDIPAIIKAALKAGTKYFIVEQDQSLELPALESAKESLNYLKKIETEL